MSPLFSFLILLINSRRKITPHEVEYFIRPNGAYPGGNYGSYGGYDIILIKLKKPADKQWKPICLPQVNTF